MVLSLVCVADVTAREGTYADKCARQKRARTHRATGTSIEQQPLKKRNNNKYIFQHRAEQQQIVRHRCCHFFVSLYFFSFLYHFCFICLMPPERCVCVCVFYLPHNHNHWHAYHRIGGQCIAAYIYPIYGQRETSRQICRRYALTPIRPLYNKATDHLVMVH